MDGAPLVLDIPTATTQPNRSVAIVHDYLNQRGGAERVVLEMARMWPDAPIYTSLYRPDSVFGEFGELDVRTTFLDRAPLDSGFRALAPLLPAAFRSMGVLDHDVVISSSSGWAHSVRTATETVHIVYCYAPARWLYSADRYFERRSRQLLAAPMGALGRFWDRRAASRADAYIAIAQNVRDRIRSTYGLDSDVVYPPVDVSRFRPTPRGDRLLTISRLLPYKRIDLVVAAATRIGVPLDVVGDGPMFSKLRATAGPSVKFHGVLNEDTLLELIQGCSAVCMPGYEDFGIVAVEGNAAGKPAIALASGGALETIEDGINGALFAEPTVESLIDAIRRLEGIDTSPEKMARFAGRFSVPRFRHELLAAVESAIERK